MEWLATRGATQCELNVWEFNRGAAEFYESMGFETISRRMGRMM
jgi:ribosomal protein S18 acetylase RimI-like enzyme